MTDKKDKPTELVYPYDSAEFKAAWNAWIVYKEAVHKFKYKSVISEQAALMHLDTLSDHNEDIAIDIIRYSMGRQWKGFFMYSDLEKKLKARQNEQRPLGWRRNR